MKKIIVTFILALFFVSALNKVSMAQCKQQVVYNCATDNDHAIYLRDFNTKLKKEKKGVETGTKWTVVLNKGTRYRFNLCSPDGFEDKIVMTLYDSQHLENKNPYGSTWDQATNKDNKKFDFVCQKSGMYYVSIRYKEGQGDKKSCAVGILSFVGKNK